ncbi:hypothetical protein [Streptomyces sp. 142MFCol3.1]|uniref:hypothetical protein n=1 Tax=Streptomyces sp. 142MFCol3.1 TaxID=1172179 RepID=UPI0004297A59|nr:hypothetical protein [Streptomyces sp. 142MFCol3.1]
MTENHAPISETGLGYDVFAPLWGILELGVVAESGAQALRGLALAGFVAAHRKDIDGLLAMIRDLGDFSSETMAIFEEQGGWNDGRQVTSEYLTMYSGCIEGYPPETGDPVVLRRIVRMGSDLQLATFMDALVGTATARGPGLGVSVPLVADAVRMAGALLGFHDERVVRDTFRMWRVKFLPDVLRPDSPSGESVKADLRLYARALEELVDERS